MDHGQANAGRVDPSDKINEKIRVTREPLARFSFMTK